MINGFGGGSLGKSAAPAHFPGATWDTRTDAEAGFNTTALNSFETQINATWRAITRDGYMVRSNNDSTGRDWASAGKAILALLTLFALDDAEISAITETINTHANINFAFTGNDGNITWEHLMSMQANYAISEDPGAAFNYNDYAIRLYGEALKDLYGEATDLGSTLSTKLTALGLQDTITWINGGTRINISPRDFARIGWLIANEFNWDGTQILPASYKTSYVIPQVADDQTISTNSTIDDYLTIGTFGGGAGQSSFGAGIYGFATWHNDFVGGGANRTWPSAPTDTLVFDGHFGTEIVAIMPSLGIVAAWDGADQSFAPGTADSGLDVALGLLADAVI